MTARCFWRSDRLCPTDFQGTRRVGTVKAERGFFPPSCSCSCSGTGTSLQSQPHIHPMPHSPGPAASTRSHLSTQQIAMMLKAFPMAYHPLALSYLLSSLRPDFLPSPITQQLGTTTYVSSPHLNADLSVHHYLNHILRQRRV